MLPDEGPGGRSRQYAIRATLADCKTLCYQIPILDDLVRDPRPGLRAVIIYPLNALVNDQLTEWETMLSEYPDITFARFTGQTPKAQSDYVTTIRDAVREELVDRRLTRHELEQKVEQRVAERLRADIPNRLGAHAHGRGVAADVRRRGTRRLRDDGSVGFGPAGFGHALVAGLGWILHRFLRHRGDRGEHEHYA